MDQTKTSKAFQKSLHAVSKLRSRRSSHSPSQLFSTPLIYVAWLFILPLSGPFVCLVCIQKIHPRHPLPTLGHSARKKKIQSGEAAVEKALRFLTHPLLCKFLKTFLRGKWNCHIIFYREGKKSQREAVTCCLNVHVCITIFYLISLASACSPSVSAGPSRFKPFLKWISINIHLGSESNKLAIGLFIYVFHSYYNDKSGR